MCDLSYGIDLETGPGVVVPGAEAHEVAALTAQLNRSANQIDDVDCPVCHVRMHKVADPKQTHIWMEQCPQCAKVFLDAGEFSDLKYDTFMDRVRGLLRGKRPAD